MFTPDPYTFSIRSVADLDRANQMDRQALPKPHEDASTPRGKAMPTDNKGTFIYPLSISLVGCLASIYPAYSGTNPDTQTVTQKGDHTHFEEHETHDHSHHISLFEQKTGYETSTAYYTVPDVSLIDNNNHPVSIQKAIDSPEPVLLNFIFTSCTSICPVMSATFSNAHKHIVENGEFARFISISIDPEYDTPARLQEYARQHNARPNWKFFTGTLEDIERVQKAFGAYRGDKMNHTPITFLRAHPEDPWVRIDGFTSTEDLLKEYHALRAQ